MPRGLTRRIVDASAAYLVHEMRQWGEPPKTRRVSSDRAAAPFVHLSITLDPHGESGVWSAALPLLQGDEAQCPLG